MDRSQATVSHRIQVLERQVACLLFTRCTTDPFMAPTEAAHVLAPHVRLLLLILAVIRDQLPTARQIEQCCVPIGRDELAPEAAACQRQLRRVT
jgi:DNA-binding transcriptional LysR family regulator